MNGKHPCEDLVSPMPSDAEIETAMRRARRERSEMAHLLFRRARAWLARLGANTTAPATAGPIQPARIAAARH